jgi:hypothetical protein
LASPLRIEVGFPHRSFAVLVNGRAFHHVHLLHLLRSFTGLPSRRRTGESTSHFFYATVELAFLHVQKRPLFPELFLSCRKEHEKWKLREKFLFSVIYALSRLGRWLHLHRLHLAAKWHFSSSRLIQLGRQFSQFLLQLLLILKQVVVV